MGTLAVKGAAAGFDVYMATPDKDAAQLVQPGIRLYRPAHAGDSAEIYDEQKVCEHWHLREPKQMIDYLALAGDSSDNIPGIRGVGEKTATDLLSKFGDVEGIIANVDKIKGKLAEKVFAGRDDATMSKFLTTIRTDVPIEPDWNAYKLDGVDRGKLAAVCEKFELRRLAKELLGEDDLVGSALRADRGRLGEAPLPMSTGSLGETPLTHSTIATAPHDYRLVTDETAAQALLAELMAAPRVAFDIETAAREPGLSATDANTCRLLGLSFSTAPGKAWYVIADLVDVFRPLFADKSKILVAHNGKYDRTVLHRYGIGFAPTPHDTMLEHYCLDAAARHGLKELSEQLLGYRMIRFEDVAGEPERGKPEPTLAGKDLKLVCDYASEDADFTLRLDDILRPQVPVAPSPLPNVLSDVEEPLVKILIDMEREGVKIDVEALKAYGRELDREILSLTQQILSYADPGFNPDSPKQLGALLFGKLGLSGGMHEAQVDIRRQAADAHRRERTRPYDIRAGVYRDGAPKLVRPESPEHSDPHRTRQADTKGVRRARRKARPHLGRLLADRTATHGRDVGRRGDACCVQERRGHSPRHCEPGVRRDAGVRDARAALEVQDGELRHHLRHLRVRALAAS